MRKKIQVAAAIVSIVLALAGGWSATRAIAEQRSVGKTYFVPFTSMTPVIEGIGPDGGGVTAMALNTKNSQVAYTGTWGAGVFKTSDAGLTWKAASSGLDNLLIQSLALDPLHPDVIYAGTYRSGVYKSTDGAKSWAYAGAGLNNQAIVYALAVDPVNPQNVYAGTRSPGMNPPWGGGVYKSNDGGKTWLNHTFNMGEDWVYGLAVDPGNPQIVYAATHSAGVYKSVDGGHNWQAVNNGISDTSMRTVAIDPSNTQVVYAGVWHRTGVFKTTNGGKSWSVINNGLNNAKIISITIDPVQPRTLYALSFLQGLYKSDDAGGSWTAMGLWPDYVFSLLVNPSNHDKLLASAVNIAVYGSSSGGTTWSSASSGLYATTVTSIAADQALPGVVFAGLNGMGVYRSGDGGQTWTAANGGLGDFNVRSLALVGASLYVGTDSGGIYKTSSQGADWHPLSLPLPKVDMKVLASNQSLKRFDNRGPAEDLMPNDAAVQPKAVTISSPILALAAAPSSSSILLAGTGGSGVYRTTNAGADWQPAGLDGRTVMALTFDRTNPAVAYAGTNAAGGSLWKSVDGGNNWNPAKAGLDGLDVQSLSPHPSQSSMLYAGTNQGVYQSTNGGASWTQLGLNGQVVYALLANPYLANNLAAGTAAGLYLSSDGGKTWSIQKGLVNPEVWSLAVGAASTRMMFIGTQASGMYRYYAPPTLY